MTKKTSNAFDIDGWWKLSNDLNLGLIYLDALGRNLVTKDNTLGNHEVTLLSIEHQVSFLASLQYDV